MVTVVEGVEWRHIYFVKGPAPKSWMHRFAVNDPPNAGWHHAFVLPGEKRSTIFSPYTLDAYTVPNECGELQGATEPRDEFRPDFIRSLMENKWNCFQGWGHSKDYDTCALVMRKLGWEVPAQIMTGGEEDTRKKGGKEVGSSLLKPVKESSKRGKFLKWFLDGDGSRSVREAMAEFAMTRSNALSYLYMIQKDHGIGYELVGDIATVTLPEGCTDPFNASVADAEEDPTCEQCGGHLGREGHKKTCPLITGVPDEMTGEDEDDDDDDSWLE